MAIKTQTLSGPERFGYLAQPDAGARAGVLILPTIFGVNAFARGYADMLADNGFAAAVWDINSGLPLTTDYQECIKRARTLTDEAVVAMVTKWTDAMLGELKLEAIGVAGFCIGGRFILQQCALDKRIKACAAAYPSIEHPRLANQNMDSLALAADIECPVLVLQPGKDHVSQPGTYAILKDSLHKREAPTVWHTYPVAEHGFMHRPTPDENVKATALAAPQMLSFLKACLT
jgi:carboxymethylenebutenolidase